MADEDGQDRADERRGRSRGGDRNQFLRCRRRPERRRTASSAAADGRTPHCRGNPAEPGRARRQGRGRRILSWVMLVAGAILLAGTAWVGWQSYQAYRHLDQASAQVTVLQDQLTNIAAEDPAATARTLDGSRRSPPRLVPRSRTRSTASRRRSRCWARISPPCARLPSRSTRSRPT